MRSKNYVRCRPYRTIGCRRLLLEHAKRGADGIASVKSVAISGEIAALARDLGRIDPAALARESGPLLAARRSDMAIRPFLERLYRPADGFRVPVHDDVIVCRCEKVRRGDIAKAVREGCPGPNQIKSFTCSGMGPCQGRMCGHTVVETIAALSGQAPANVGYFRIRMPIKPVTVGDVAGMTAIQEKNHEQTEADRV